MRKFTFVGSAFIAPLASALLMLGASLYLLLAITIPGKGLFWAATQNAGHVVIFALGGFMLCAIANKLWVAVSNRHLFFGVFFLCMSYAGLIELIQSKIGREASWEDIYLDAAGTSIACLCYGAYYRFSKQRYGLLSLVILIAAISFSKPLYYGYASYVYRQEFPILFDGEKNILNDFVGIQTPASLSIEAAPEQWVNNRSQVAAVTFASGDWPAFELTEPFSKWNGYQYLTVDIYNPHVKEISLHLRVHDKQHNHSYNDRFNKVYSLPHGPSTLKILLDYIKNQPKTRKLDMHNIDNIMFFMSNPSAEYIVYFDNIQLTQ